MVEKYPSHPPPMTTRPNGAVFQKTAALRYISETIMPAMWDHEKAWPFTAPVDTVLFKLKDYCDIIENPMDMGTIKARLHLNFYKDSQECVKDFGLIFHNCYLYNKPGDEVTDMAKDLENYLRSSLRKLPKEHGHKNLHREFPKADAHRKLHNGEVNETSQTSAKKRTKPMPDYGAEQLEAQASTTPPKKIKEPCKGIGLLHSSERDHIDENSTNVAHFTKKSKSSQLTKGRGVLRYLDPKYGLTESAQKLRPSCNIHETFREFQQQAINEEKQSSFNEQTSQLFPSTDAPPRLPHPLLPTNKVSFNPLQGQDTHRHTLKSAWLQERLEAPVTKAKSKHIHSHPTPRQSSIGFGLNTSMDTTFQIGPSKALPSVGVPPACLTGREGMRPEGGMSLFDTGPSSTFTFGSARPEDHDHVTHQGQMKPALQGANNASSSPQYVQEKPNSGQLPTITGSTANDTFMQFKKLSQDKEERNQRKELMKETKRKERECQAEERKQQKEAEGKAALEKACTNERLYGEKKGARGHDAQLAKQEMVWLNHRPPDVPTKEAPPAKRFKAVQPSEEWDGLFEQYPPRRRIPLVVGNTNSSRKPPMSEEEKNRQKELKRKPCGPPVLNILSLEEQKIIAEFEFDFAETFNPRSNLWKCH